MTDPFRARCSASVFFRDGQARCALVTGLWLLLGAASPARAEGPDIPCGPVERGSIHIDGLTSDWEGVPELALGVNPQGPGAVGAPLRAGLRCNYDDQALYLLVRVDDDVLVRTTAAGPQEDHLELGFAAPGKKKDELVMERLLLWPASSNPRVPRAARWESRKPLRLIEGEGPAGRMKPLSGPPSIEVYEAMQPRGYAVELRLPYALLPGYRPGLPLPLSVRVVDSDSRARPQVVATAETAPLSRPEELSRVQPAELQSGMESLLQHLKLTASDIWWERSGDLGNGPTRVLMLGRNLVTLGKEYGYQEVAATRGDVKEVQLLDLGEGRQAVLLRAAEHSSGGSRETLRVWAMRGGRFMQLLAMEVAKLVGTSALRTQVSVITKKGKPLELLLTPQPAQGFTEETYLEVPAEDVQPILLPWRDKKARFVYRAGAFSRSE